CSCAAPDFPGRFRISQLFQKPRFLLGTEQSLRGIRLANVRNLLVPETDGAGRIASVVVAAAIDYLKHLFRHELRIVLIKEICVIELGSGVLGSVASLVGDDEFYIPAPAQRPISSEAVDRCEVIRFFSETVVVELRHCDISDCRRIETFERGTTALHHTRGLVLKKRLHGCDLARLRWMRFFVEHLQGLPSLPAELMVVPHRNEGPASAGVLQVGIVQVTAIHGAVAIHVDRDVEVVNLLSLRIANEVPDLAVVVSGAILRIPDQLVDEVAEVQDKAEALLLRSALVLEDHPPIGILRAEICVLATDKREAYGSRIAIGRRGDGAAEATAVTLGIGKAIPIDLGWLQSADQYPTGPIRVGRN